jgi:formylglycine-generating enzyme required for sulfatase activity
MKKLRIFLLFAVFIFAATIFRMLDVKAGDSASPKPGAVFRDCSDCPEMVVIPTGSFTMGSSASEKTWAATHGLDAGFGDEVPQHKLSLQDFASAVADEAPQHKVSLRSFALGKYDVMRREYAAFVNETGSVRWWLL